MHTKEKVAVLLLSVVLSTTFVAVATSNLPQPNMQVAVSLHRSSPDNGYDSVVYVNLPTQQQLGIVGYQTPQFFIVQSFSISDVRPDGTIDPPQTFVTCTITSLNVRNALLDCSGSLFPWRVNPQVYPGSSTGIYYLGMGGFSQTGIWTFTYTVTGLYNGQTVTLTKSFNLNIDPPVSGGPIQFT